MTPLLSYGEKEVVSKLKAVIEANRPSEFPLAHTFPYSMETLMEYVGKVKNAHVEQDYARRAYFASKVAEFSWHTLRACSRFPTMYTGESQDFQDRYAVGETIPGYVQNMEACQGLKVEPRTIDEIVHAAIQLGLLVVDSVCDQVDYLPVEPVFRELLETRLIRKYLLQ